MSDPIRMGIVGFGGMGQGHARTVSGIEGIELVAVADPSPGSRESAEALGVETFSNHRDLTDRAEVDAVLVASPSNTHGTVVKQCCERGIHVFCEKPFTTTFEEAVEVGGMVSSSDIVFSIGLVLRHSQTYREAKRLIDAGEIGDVGLAQCRYSGHMLGRYDYVFSRTLGRGLINEHTIHMIDVMEFLLGSVDSVFAATDSCEEHTEYNAAILMRHETDAFTAISASGVSRLPGYARITGMKGELMAESNSRLIFKDEDGERELISAPLGYDHEIEDFRDAILNGKETLTGIEKALSSSRLIEAIYRSAELGRKVELSTLT